MPAKYPESVSKTQMAGIHMGLSQVQGMGIHMFGNYVDPTEEEVIEYLTQTITVLSAVVEACDEVLSSMNGADMKEEYTSINVPEMLSVSPVEQVGIIHWKGSPSHESIQ